MSRRRTHAGSLDLLLDTMCNALGGVMFLSLLLALLSERATLEARAERHDLGVQELREIEELRRELTSLDAELQERQALKQWNDSNRESRSDPEASSNRKKLRDLVSRTRSLEAENEKLARKLSRMSATVRASESGQISRTRKLEEERKAVDDLQVKLNTHLRDHARPLRMPRVHESRKAPFWFVVKAGELHPCFVITDRRAGDPWVDHPGIDVKKYEGYSRYTVRAGQGQNLRIQIARGKYTSEIRDTFDTNRVSLHFAVYPDSFEEFAALRDHLVLLGFSYNWVPIPEGQDLMLTLTTKVKDQ